MTNSEKPNFKIQYFNNISIDLTTLENQHLPTVEDKQYEYNPFHIENLQNYNPVYQSFFELDETNYNNISLNHTYHIQDLLHVINEETREITEKHVHIKYSPLLDPLKYMIGKYKSDLEGVYILPNILANKSHPKIIDINNASYVDNFFSFLCSKLLHTHCFLHGVDYYGSFLGIQKKFKMNIIDDLDYLSSSDHFKQNLNKQFFLTNIVIDEFMNFGSRSNKQKLIIDNENIHNITAIEIDGLESNLLTNLEETTEVVYEKTNNNSKSNSSTNSSNNSDSNYSTEESDSDNDDDDDEHNNNGWETSSETDSNSSFNESAKYVYINKFPVQLICLEKCNGTLDELFESGKIVENEASSILFQIVMILITYQKAFHFTHNDLHTNNIMFINTDIEFLFYRYKNTTYKVPTYGKIYKLIDFGRGIYRFQGKSFCSDSFSIGGDASTQYNFEPYLNENKPRLDPNYSFDLCRLGCSIYDFIIDSDSPEDIENFDELQKTIYRWCTDDNGKNILYMSNGDERYPGFKLYKMIARSVHNHLPEDQLNYDYFKQFKLSPKKSKNIDREAFMDIDAIPSYV
jgi:hypothetical protein